MASRDEQSKKPSSTTRRRRKNHYFLDRNLGRKFLPEQLRKAGLQITAQDDTEEFKQAERDPWLFYQCGKRKVILVTSDRDFMKSFPHMAAVSLGNTVIIAFTKNNYNSDVRGCAFIKALQEIEDAISAHRKKKRNFIGVVGIRVPSALQKKSRYRIESYAIREIGKAGNEYAQKREFWP